MNKQQKQELDAYIENADPNAEGNTHLYPALTDEEYAAEKESKELAWPHVNAIQRLIGTTKVPTMPEVIEGMAANGFDVKFHTLRIPRKDFNPGVIGPLYTVSYSADVWIKTVEITATGARNELKEVNRHYGFGCGVTPFIAIVDACGRAIIKRNGEKEVLGT